MSQRWTARPTLEAGAGSGGDEQGWSPHPESPRRTPPTRLCGCALCRHFRSGHLGLRRAFQHVLNRRRWGSLSDIALAFRRVHGYHESPRQPTSSRRLSSEQQRHRDAAHRTILGTLLSDAIASSPGFPPHPTFRQLCTAPAALAFSPPPQRPADPAQCRVRRLATHLYAAAKGFWVPVIALDRPSFWDFASSPDGRLVRTLVFFNETRTERRVQQWRLTLWEAALLRQPHTFPAAGRLHGFKSSASYSWGHKYSK